MSNDTTKKMSEFDQQMILQKVYNPEEGTLAIGSFVAGKLGHRIDRAIISSTVDEYSYHDNSLLLYTLRVTYSNAAHDDVNSFERVV